MSRRGQERGHGAGELSRLQLVDELCELGTFAGNLSVRSEWVCYSLDNPSMRP